jgi:PAS domain S-box-containing protein
VTGQGDERTGGDMEEYRQLIETTFRSLKDAVFVVKHPERVIETCNPAAEQMFGWDASELVGSSTRRLHVDDAHYERFGRESEQALAETGRYQGEFRMRRADGSTLFTEHVVSFVGSSDDPDRAVSVVRDITERKEMEESLRKQERLYRTLFEEAGEGFLIQSLDDVVLDGNEAACELLGYPRDELQGMSLEQITPDALQEESGSGGIVRHLLNKHGSTMFYWHYVRHDGTEVPVEKSITPIMHHGTEAVLVCIRDRTELERIRKKDERKSSFVSQVTHDLRTPLNSITGMGGLLMETDLSGKQQNYLQTILNAARNMERLTNDILDLNRIERNELLLDEEPFHPQQLLGKVISLYGQQVGDRDVIMSTQVSEDVPERLIGDPARLKQILHNLVDNAIKHTQEGTIRIDIDCEQQKGASVVLSVSVSDRGPVSPIRISPISSRSTSRWRKKTAPARNWAWDWACRSAGTLSS